MKQLWDISAIKEPKYLPSRKVWEVYGVLPKRDANGKRKRLRKVFDTKEQAIAFRKSQQDEWQVYSLQGNVRKTRLTEEQESDAINSLKLIRTKFPDSWESISLFNAVSFYCNQYDPNHKIMLLDDAIKRYLKSPKISRSSDLHQKQTRNKLETFREHFDNREVSDFTADEMEEYIYDENKDWADKTRANHYAILHTFFNFCLKKDLLLKNPVSKVDKPAPENLEPVALSIPEVEKLMKIAEEVDAGSMIPYFALAIFSAVRPSEILRLRWEKFVWDDDKPCFVVEVKGKRRRSVDMHETCIKWIKPLAQEEGDVAPANAKKLFNLIRAIAGYRVSRSSIEIAEAEEWESKLQDLHNEKRPEWVRDVMRHTGITYYHRLINDKNQVASWAGNSPQIIDSNYRAVDGVTASTCKKFWAIVPSY